MDIFKIALKPYPVKRFWGLFFGFLGGKTTLKMCNELKKTKFGEKEGFSPKNGEV